MSRSRTVFGLLIAAVPLGGACAPQASRTLLVTDGKVWTADPAHAQATAFVVRDGKFTYVGNDQTAKERAGEDAEHIDLNGSRVVPGMIDAHLHLINGGMQLARLNLRDVPDRAAFIDAIALRARQTPEGGWVLGGRYSTESWPDPTQPNKSWIDAATADHPVLLSRMDGHGALANSVALKIAGINRDGPADPPGGEIERAPETREPTGILKDAAIGLVGRHVPAPSDDENDHALKAAMVEANRHGLTGVHTMSSWADLAALDRARRAGKLTLRVRLYVSEADWSPYVDKIKHFPADEWIRISGFKQFMDGSLGSRTAYMAMPFDDNPPDKPNRRGLLTEFAQNAGRMEKMCRLADAAGLNPAIHAIGDQANHLLLNIYEEVANANGPRDDRRFRIEHAQHLLPNDVRRFGKLGVVASMQPLHKADDGRYAEQVIGSARCRSSYTFGDLLATGATLAFGSDWPVVSLNPFLGLHAAVTGRTLDGKVFVPEQNVTVQEALSAYTTGAAYAAGDEHRLGRIKPGYLADFVILEVDPMSAAPERLKDIRVKETYVNGRRVWPE